MNNKKQVAGTILMFGALGCGTAWFGWWGFAVVVVALMGAAWLSDG